jgi:diguanylate cyclase (GGDEF)-like protein
MSEKFENIYEILTKDNIGRDYFELRKEMVVRVFLYVAAFVLVGFGFINIIFYQRYAVGFIDFLAFFGIILALKSIKEQKTLQKAIVISSFNLFVFFLFYIIFNQNYDFGLIWSIFLPIFIIPINGHKKGLVLSLIFYAIAIVLAYNGIGEWQDGQWNFHSFLRFSIASLVLVYVTYINELAIYKNNVLLQEKENKEQKYIKKLQEMAKQDHLTGIYNRRYISELSSKEIKEAKRYEKNLSIAILDIDYFKNINDTYGHNIGDSVLKVFSKIISENIRDSDLFGRWGGEEFIIVFTNTSLDQAYEKCLKLKELIENYKFEKVHKITCSIGVASIDASDRIYDIIERADKALYEAKQSGRNKVVKYEEISKKG